MTNEPDLEGAYALETPDDNRRFYAAWAEDYDATFVTGTTYQFPQVVAARYVASGGGWPCLDVGCGTGAIASRMPRNALVDGLDLSPDMLAVAQRGGRYRETIEADLLKTLPLDDGSYQGMVSAGTFTHGHVGPEALPELIRILAPGGLAVLTVKPEVWDVMGFGPAFDALIDGGAIADLTSEEIDVYADPSCAPEGHGGDKGILLTFRRV